MIVPYSLQMSAARDQENDSSYGCRLQIQIADGTGHAVTSGIFICAAILSYRAQ
jgi:hypothetical protein